MQNVNSFPVVKGARGATFQLESGATLIDAISSWWVAIHGYNHPTLNRAIMRQGKKFSHIMLGGLTHRPAIDLADKLVQITPQGLNHVFFSDSGSVAVEVALKMAFQYWINSGNYEKDRILSLKNAYHGDTFKAMEVSDDSDFTATFSRHLRRGYVLPTPHGGFGANEETLMDDIRSLGNVLKEYSHSIAAFIIEPIVQCAGGFKIYSPQYLKAARHLCDKYNVLMIFDEVATGFGRTGKLFAAEHAGVTPDVLILGKALTGGYIGHAATISNSMIYESFLGEDYRKAFMHGPTFMGNPLACAVSLTSIELFEREEYLEKIKKIESIIVEEFASITSELVKEKRVLGSIGAIEVCDGRHLEGLQTFAIENGVWLRPIGNVTYIMPPYIITECELRKVLGVLKNWFM